MRLHLLFALIVACCFNFLQTNTALADKDPNGILAKRVGLWKATGSAPRPLTQ